MGNMGSLETMSELRQWKVSEVRPRCVRRSFRSCVKIALRTFLRHLKAPLSFANDPQKGHRQPNKRLRTAPWKHLAVVWYDKQAMGKQPWFNQAHRRVYGEKATEFSLLTVGGLILAQVLSEKGVSPQALFLGIIFFVLGSIISYLFLKGIKGGGHNEST